MSLVIIVPYCDKTVFSLCIIHVTQSIHFFQDLSPAAPMIDSSAVTHQYGACGVST